MQFNYEKLKKTRESTLGLTKKELVEKLAESNYRMKINMLTSYEAGKKSPNPRFLIKFISLVRPVDDNIKICDFYNHSISG